MSSIPPNKPSVVFHSDWERWSEGCTAASFAVRLERVNAVEAEIPFPSPLCSWSAPRTAPGQVFAFTDLLTLLSIPLGMENDDTAVQYAIGRSDTVAPGTGIDLEFDADVQTMSPEASEYETCYVTSHKGPCRVATYSRDGQLIATGSADASIKILDTERMLAKSAMPIEVPFPPTVAPDSVALLSPALVCPMGLWAWTPCLCALSFYLSFSCWSRS